MHDLPILRRRIAETPTITAAMVREEPRLQPGPVAFEGRAAATVPLIRSPISGVPLIGYRIQFHELGFFRRIKHSFALRRVTDFAALIGGHQVDVCPAAHCYLYLTHEYGGTPEEFGSVSSRAYGLFADHQPRSKTMRAPRIEWHEYYLEPGEPIYVCGWLKEEFDMSRGEGYRSHHARAVICGTEEHPLIIADYGRAELLAKIDKAR